MPTDEEIAAAKAAEEKTAKELADKEAAEAKELGVGDKGLAAIKAEREARKAAELASTEANKELAKLRKAQSDAEAAKAKEAEEAAAKKGEFEKLATDRAAERDAAKSELEAAKAEVEHYGETLKPIIKEKLDAVPEAARDGFPKDGTAREQLDWLNDPRTVALIAQSSEEARVLDAQGKPKMPRTPNANGNTEQQVLEAERQRAQATGKYAI